VKVSVGRGRGLGIVTVPLQIVTAKAELINEIAAITVRIVIILFLLDNPEKTERIESF
jgi:hypothetical protein